MAEQRRAGRWAEVRRWGGRRLVTVPAVSVAAGLLVLLGPGFATAQAAGSLAAGTGVRAASAHRVVSVSRPRPEVSAPLLTGPPRAAAVSFVNTYTVDTTSDLPWTPGACASGNPDTCSLRAAVTQANDDATLDEIVLPSGSYLLETDELVITDPAGVYLQGAGAGTTTVQADSTSPAYPFRVFQLNGGAQANISGLTITDGSTSTSSAAPTAEDGYGGGIEVLDGTLDLTSATVTVNSAEYDGAGIYVAGQNSVGSGVQSRAYFSDVTISDNTASGNGGGLDDEGQVQAKYLTVSGNTADGSYGGGIDMSYTGSYGPSLDGTAVTVTGNAGAADGGGIYDDGSLLLTGSTIGANGAPNSAPSYGGGLYVYYQATLESTSVSYNTAGTQGAGIYDDYQLVMNGGSVEHNEPIGADSIDGGGIYDAYDVTLARVTVSGNGADAGAGVYQDCCSLSVTGGSISGNTATTNGGGVYTDNSLTLKNVSLSGNMANNGGGIYEACCGLTMTGGSITDNSAMTGGGGLWNFYPAHLTYVTIAGNSAPSGGGVYDNDGDLTFSHVTVGTWSKPNSAEFGGGIYAYESSETIVESTIEANAATDSGQGEGGGIFDSGSFITITGSTLTGNTVDMSGGGLYNATSAGSYVDVVGSTFSWNTAASSGGGVQNEAAVTMTNDTLVGNKAGTTSSPGTGGGIFTDTGGNTALTNVTLSGNAALDGGDGGGVYNDGTLQLRGTLLAGNTGGTGQTNCGGTAATSNGYNLESDTSCGFTGPGDLNGKDPDLGPLRYNGGPTKTEAIPVTSPAVDADSACPPPAVDQRGVKRRKPCDIGAYENTRR